MSIQQGSANLFIALTKGTITVMHGTSGDVLLEKTNAPAGSWESLCEAIKNICSDNPTIQSTKKIKKGVKQVGEIEALTSESKVKGYLRKICIYPKRDVKSIKETEGAWEITLKDFAYKPEDKLIANKYNKNEKGVWSHPTINLIFKQ